MAFKEPGKDGHTPVITIGENGNWFIDGVDTTKPAQGIQGNPGENAPHYGEKHTVTFNLDGGELPEGYESEIVVTWGDTLDLPVPHKYGYNFIGWFTGETVNDSQFCNKDAVFRDLTLYAKYEIGTFTITLNLDGGTYDGPLSFEFQYLSDYSLPTNISKDGFIFLGWLLGEETFPNYGVFEYENITLNAMYEELLNYTIFLDLNGGTYDGPTEIVVEELSQYTLPKTGVKNGSKVFMGWYNGDEKWAYTGTYFLNENISLTANWYNINYNYLISLNYNGGTCTESIVSNIDTSQIFSGYALPVPTKPNYTFIGYTCEHQFVTNEFGELQDAALDVLSHETSGGFGTSYVVNDLKAMYVGNDSSYVGDYIYFGKYPQSEVKNRYLMYKLENATDVDNDGYIEYKDNEYLKISGKSNNGYDKDTIYYFEVEPILWQIKSDGKLVSEFILDNICYYVNSEERNYKGDTIYANNYEYSTIRAFLNGYNGSEYQVDDYQNKGFYNIAFNDIEKEQILTTLVLNTVASAGNYSGLSKFVCENTNDKVFLLSVSETKANSYGHEQICKNKKGTDYAKYQGLEVLEDSYSDWWLRSPASNGYLSQICNGSNSNDTVSNGNGVVPIIKIQLP